MTTREPEASGCPLKPRIVLLGLRHMLWLVQRHYTEARMRSLRAGQFSTGDP
jgi:hypothetical protein